MRRTSNEAQQQHYQHQPNFSGNTRFTSKASEFFPSTSAVTLAHGYCLLQCHALIVKEAATAFLNLELPQVLSTMLQRNLPCQVLELIGDNFSVIQAII